MTTNTLTDNLRPLYRIFDVVLVYGTLTEEQLRDRLGEGEDITDEIEIGLHNGYLKRTKDGLEIGHVPPQFNPMSTLGGELGVRELLEGDDAMDILQSRNSVARRRPTRAGREWLRKSLMAVGQLTDVWKWKPDWASEDEAVFVDGQTRAEIVESLGEEYTQAWGPLRVSWLPENLTPDEVLLRRIHFELAGTTKDWSKDGRKQYIATLAAEGCSHREIAEVVGLSRNRVSEIVSQLSKPRHLRQDIPNPDQVAEWVAMHAAGKSFRTIAHETAWSKDTVQRRVTDAKSAAKGGGPVAVPSSARKTTPTKKQASKPAPDAAPAAKPSHPSQSTPKPTRKLSVVPDNPDAADALAIADGEVRAAIAILRARFGDDPYLDAREQELGSA